MADDDNVPSEHAPANDVSAQTAVCESLTITCRKQKKEGAYHQGDTILEAARRMGHRPPFSCLEGHCGSCMALVLHGSVVMKANDALSPEEVGEGYILACQSLPTSSQVTVVFE